MAISTVARAGAVLAISALALTACSTGGTDASAGGECTPVTVP